MIIQNDHDSCLSKLTIVYHNFHAYLHVFIENECVNDCVNDQRFAITGLIVYSIINYQYHTPSTPQAVSA